MSGSLPGRTPRTRPLGRARHDRRTGPQPDLFRHGFRPALVLLLAIIVVCPGWLTAGLEWLVMFAIVAMFLVAGLAGAR